MPLLVIEKAIVVTVEALPILNQNQGVMEGVVMWKNRGSCHDKQEVGIVGDHLIHCIAPIQYVGTWPLPDLPSCALKTLHRVEL